MSKYRKVDPGIWNDKGFRDLSDNAQLLFLFLLTHPNLTLLGAMRASMAGLAAELGHWSAERFSERFEELLMGGMVQYDKNANFVWVRNFLKYNPPDNPNVVKSWLSSLQLLPECPLEVQLYQELTRVVEPLSKGFREAFRQLLGKRSRTQEQEQEQEQEQKRRFPSESASSKKSAKRKANSFHYCPAFKAWWGVYPKGRRTQKRKTYLAWVAAGKLLRQEHEGWSNTEAATYLQERIEAFAASPAAKRIKFVLSSHRWLGHGCYDDEESAWKDLDKDNERQPVETGDDGRPTF